MTALALSPNPSLGLEHLVAQADNLSSDAPKETWDSWIQATMLALETDDSVDSRLSTSPSVMAAVTVEPCAVAWDV